MQYPEEKNLKIQNSNGHSGSGATRSVWYDKMDNLLGETRTADPSATLASLPLVDEVFHSPLPSSRARANPS